MEDTLLFQPRHMIMATPCFDPVTFVYGAVPQVMTEIRLTFLRPLTVCSHKKWMFTACLIVAQAQVLPVPVIFMNMPQSI